MDSFLWGDLPWIGIGSVEHFIERRVDGRDQSVLVGRGTVGQQRRWYRNRLLKFCRLSSDINKLEQIITQIVNFYFHKRFCNRSFILTKTYYEPKDEIQAKSTIRKIMIIRSLIHKLIYKNKKQSPQNIKSMQQPQQQQPQSASQINPSNSNPYSQSQYQSESNNQQLQSPNNEHPNLPFLISKFTKQDREKERSNRPKLGLRRLTDDKKIVSIDLDIAVDENTTIKEKFDWDLNKDKISPSDFASQLTLALNLPPDYADRLKEQILGQIMQHIKLNTRQKVAQQYQQHHIDEQSALYGATRPLQTIRFNNQYNEDDINNEQNEKKKMSRMRRKQLQRSTLINNSQPNRYFKEKKICKNCKNENVTPGFECKNCKLPFELMEMVNMDDRRVKISVKYYEKIANKIPLLVYEAKKRHFQKEDFDSFYKIYTKIRSIFQNSDELSKQNLNQVKYIMEKYHEYFLNGQLDFNDEEIIYEKESKKDQKEDENRPKRSRGRPRKIKIINDDLEPDSLGSSSDQSDEQSGQSEEESESE